MINRLIDYFCSCCGRQLSRNFSYELRREGYGWYCSFCEANIAISDCITPAGRHIVKKYYKFEAINNRRTLAPLSFKFYIQSLVKLLKKFFNIYIEVDNINCKKYSNSCPPHTHSGASKQVIRKYDLAFENTHLAPHL